MRRKNRPYHSHPELPMLREHHFGRCSAWEEVAFDHHGYNLVLEMVEAQDKMKERPLRAACWRHTEVDSSSLAGAATFGKVGCSIQVEVVAVAVAEVEGRSTVGRVQRGWPVRGSVRGGCRSRSVRDKKNCVRVRLEQDCWPPEWVPAGEMLVDIVGACFPVARVTQCSGGTLSSAVEAGTLGSLSQGVLPGKPVSGEEDAFGVVASR